jgi:hypothetical protein
MINRYNDPDYADIIVELKDELRQLQYELNDADDNFPELKKLLKPTGINDKQ